jgi:hypothetical protein
MSSSARVLPDEFESATLAEILTVLRRDEQFLSARTFREQCSHACRILRTEHDPPVPFKLIGQLFNVDGGTVYNHWRNYKSRLNEVGMAGRPAALSREELDRVVEMILRAFHERRPLTLPEIDASIRANFNKVLLRDTLYHALARDPRIRSCEARPMDEKRAQVTDDAIRDYFAGLFATVSGAPAHFVFNMDEMGHQTWVDAEKTVCFVPAEFTEPIVHYPLSRTGKRITLIGCIAADGSFLRPCLVISRKTFDDEILIHGFTPEKVEIYSQANAYIDLGIFDDWFRDTFVPDLIARRERFSYHGPAFLIMDNCPAHRGEKFDQLCALHRIIPVWLPPHSSNQLQMLDLCIFGVTKRLIFKANKLEKVNLQSDHIIRILDGFMAAAVPRNVVASFRNAGISVMLDDDRVLRCKITPETARCLLGTPFADPLAGLELTDEEEEGDPNVAVFAVRMWERMNAEGAGGGEMRGAVRDRGGNLSGVVVRGWRVIPGIS